MCRCQLTKARCCILGVTVAHLVLIIALVTSICVGFIVYADYSYLDMPSDMRLFAYHHNPLFCEGLTINAYPASPDTNGSKTDANFDAYLVHKNNVTDLKMMKRSKTINGITALSVGEPYRYYAFHWMASSRIKLDLSAKEETQDGVWVYVVKGDGKFYSILDEMKKNVSHVDCEVPSSCVAVEKVLPDSIGKAFDVTVNVTDNYYVVLYRYHNGSSSQGLSRNIDMNYGSLKRGGQYEREGQAVSLNSHVSKGRETEGHRTAFVGDNSVFKKDVEEKSISVMYSLTLDLVVYDVSDGRLTPQKAIRQSDFKTEDVYDYIILDFHYFDDAINGQDYLNIMVNIDCHGRPIIYIGVFGLTAAALIITVMVVTLVLINKRCGGDVIDMGNSGLFRDDYETM